MSIPRRLVTLAAAAVALGLATAPAHADSGKVRIDWDHHVLHATGSGAPDLHAPNIAVARLGAERAAKLDALRNILEKLKGVKVTSGTTAGGIMASDSAVKAQVQGLVRNFKVVKTHYFSDGGVEVDVEMKLDGALTSALLPPGAQQKVSTQGPKTWTGLIVDATGTKADHALAPRILDEKGKAVYGPHFVSSEAVKLRGVVGWSKSVAAAKKAGRAGDHPLVVKALSAKGTDIVITNADASSLRGDAHDLGFLASGRVVIVSH